MRNCLFLLAKKKGVCARVCLEKSQSEGGGVSLTDCRIKIIGNV